MKRYIPLLALVLAITTLFSGCSNWMEGEYLSVTPHQNKDLETEVDAVQITTYGEMRRHLAQAVESGALVGTISYMGVDRETATDYMDIACRYLSVCNAVYAYAVKKVTYSINQVENTTQISYQIEYYHGRSEVLRIQQVDSVDGASEVVYSALERGGDEVALMINPYVQINFEQMIKDLAEKNPNVVMEIPKINVRTYPSSGRKRVIALNFNYSLEQAELDKMRSDVEQVFLSADLYINDISQDKEICARLYSFLMERYDYTIQSSKTPAYSLLLDGIGDNRAFAVIYAKMCANAGVSSSVIHGNKDGIPYSWNLVRVGKYKYYIDLLACKENGEFCLMSASEMDNYTWDDLAYQSA